VLSAEGTWPVEAAGARAVPEFSADGTKVGVPVYSDFFVWDLTTGAGPSVVRGQERQDFFFGPDGRRVYSITAGSKPGAFPRWFRSWETKGWQQVLDVPLPLAVPDEAGRVSHAFDGRHLWFARAFRDRVEVTDLDGSPVAAGDGPP
jgi:hypothetical protein